MKVFIFALLSAFPSVAFAEEAHVAVAANFSGAMEKLSSLFSQETGHRLIVSYGASGKFYAQIKNGAPFEVLLSADQEIPRKMAHEGLGAAETEFTYAIGKLVLWSPDPKKVDSRGTVLAKGDFRHLSIANPKLAPYGLAAQQALERKNLWKDLQPRLVVGENINQAYQFVASGNAELGFVALSQIIPQRNPKGSFWVVPSDLYSPLKQDAILLKQGRDSVAAKAFLKFLKSDRAKSIVTALGYGPPEGAR